MGEALNYASWAPQGKSYSNYNDWLNAYNQAYASIGGSPTNNAYVGSENSLPNTYQYYVDHGGSYYKPDGTINTADPTVAASLLTGQGLYAASDADYANAQASKMANEDTGFGGMLDTLASNPASYAVLAAATAGLGGLADAGLAGTGADTTGGMDGATGLNAGGAMAGEEAAGGTGLSGLWSGLDPIIKQGLIGAGLGAGTSALTGGNIGQGALMGGLSGGIGGGITDLGGLTGIGNDIGGLVGDSTLGTDIGQGLSNIGNATGLSQLFGGTAAPTSDLSSGLNAINSTAPDLAATQGATAPVDFAPDGASSAYSAGAAAPGSTGMGGGSLSGFNAGGQMAEDTAVGSTMGGSLPWQAPDYVNPAASVAGDTATGYTPLSYGTPITGEGVGLAQQPSITEQFSNALSPSNNAGTFNFDAAGNAAGNSSIVFVPNRS